MGKTFYFDADKKGLRKHPHAYGEDLYIRFRFEYKEETSPRVWGRLVEAVLENSNYRNIPTRMGKTWSKKKHCQKTKKHPHAYGEDLIKR